MLNLEFIFSVMLLSYTRISLSFCLLSFIFALSFTQPFVCKWPISVLKKDVFLGQKGHGQKHFLGLCPQIPPFLLQVKGP